MYRIKKLYLILGCLIGTTDAIVNDADIKLYLILGCLIGTYRRCGQIGQNKLYLILGCLIGTSNMIYSIIDFFLAILNTIVIRMQGPAWYKGQSTSIFSFWIAYPYEEKIIK